jgi:ribonuclease P protein component
MSADPAPSLSETPRRRFPARLRVLHKPDFDRAMKNGVRLIDDRFVCWCARNGLAHARLGLVVGRKHGNAPQRNRLKRLIREAFRLDQRGLPAGIDFVISPRIGVMFTLADLRASLDRLAERAARRLNSADA